MGQKRVSASPPCNALYAGFSESCTKFVCRPCRLEDGISVTGYGERTQSFRRARRVAAKKSVWKTLRASRVSVKSCSTDLLLA
ncbi:MAG: hypothetical protein J5875_13360 [Paludibacteraceae bacterium]|nr:hypothetical protein [Paludibacteraceae bacterium]